MLKQEHCCWTLQGTCAATVWLKASTDCSQQGEILLLVTEQAGLGMAGSVNGTVSVL